MAAAPFAAAPPGVIVEHLFDVPPAASAAGMGVAGPAAASWFSIEYPAGEALGLGAEDSDWDAAYQLLAQGVDFAPGAKIVAAEPDIAQDWIEPPPATPFAAAAAAAACTPDNQDPAPLAKGASFAWHLGPGFSELGEARDNTGAGTEITIAHLDTGYDPNQRGLAGRLDTSRQRSFVNGENPNDASDHTPPGAFLKQYGHGTGTAGILVGGDMFGMQVAAFGPLPHLELGGAPEAKVVPVRIANSVIQLWTSTVAKGFGYARQIGADVVSMSLGGLPSLAWADAVNSAYDAGIVIVCAAGNNFGGFPVSGIVWPARFNRVIAACGIMADGRPYFHLPINIMQGNYGPASAMKTAMAAYTPNIPWLRIGCTDVVDLDGAGTSSATPQIAAAAALWLRKNKNAMNGWEPWQRVEAARKALFQSAKGHGAGPDEFFGEGIVQANAALGVAPVKAAQPTPRDRTLLSFLDGLGGPALAEDPSLALIQTEISQLAQRSKGAREAVPDPDVDPGLITEAQRRRFLRGDPRRDAGLDDASPVS